MLRLLTASLCFAAALATNDNEGKWASDNIEYTCVAEEGFNLNTLAGASTVDTIRDLRGDQPIIEWARNYSKHFPSDGPAAHEDERVQEYAKELGYLAIPGFVMLAATFWLFAICCCSHLCCPSCFRKCCSCCPGFCACGPTKRVEKYTTCEKRVPHACFMVWAVGVALCAVLGIAAFGTVGEGMQKTGCAAENLLKDARGFVFDFEQPIQFVAKNALAIIEDAGAKANDTDAIKAGMTAHLAKVTDVVNTASAGSAALTTSIESMGLPASQTELSQYDAVAMSASIQAAADTALDVLESVETEVQTYLADPKDTIVDLSASVSDVTESLYDFLDDAEREVTNRTVVRPEWLPSFFLSKDEYKGYNDVLADMRENIYFWGLLFFTFQLLAAPMLVFGDFMVHFTQPKAQGGLSRYSSDDEPPTEKLERTCANKSGVCILRCGCCLLVLGCFFCFFFSSLIFVTSALYSDVCLVVEDFPVNMHKYSVMTTEGGGNGGNGGLGDNLEPATFLDACFNGESLVDKLNMTGSFAHIIEQGLNFTGTGTVDVAGSFTFEEWVSFNEDITAMSPEAFGWQQANMDKLELTCNSCEGFGDVITLLGISAPAMSCEDKCLSADNAELATCGKAPACTVAGGAGAVCLQQQICDARDQYQTIHDDIVALKAELTTKANDVNASEQELEALVLAWQNDLLAVETQVNPLVDEIRSLGNTTYCSFVKTRYDAVDDGMCELTLGGLYNTSILMFLAALYSIPLIWSQMLLETRVAGVGQSKSFRRKMLHAAESFRLQMAHLANKRSPRGSGGGGGGRPPSMERQPDSRGDVLGQAEPYPGARFPPPAQMDLEAKQQQQRQGGSEPPCALDDLRVAAATGVAAADAVVEVDASAGPDGDVATANNYPVADAVAIDEEPARTEFAVAVVEVDDDCGGGDKPPPRQQA